jgi:hypothetical protein
LEYFLPAGRKDDLGFLRRSDGKNGELGGESPMRTGITLSGVTVLVVGAIVEVAGVLYANGILQHNAYGFAGGIFAVLGIIAISQGTRKTRQHGPTVPEKSGFEP